MKAWLIDSPQGLAKLRLGETPDPHASDGQVIIEVQYAALNPADKFLAEGQYPAKPAWPHILGRDGVGTIIEVGGGVTAFKAGDIACLLRGAVGVEQPGTLAQRVVVAADSIAPVPRGWSPEQAAAAPLVYLTAYRALTDWGDLPPSIILISGAGGGVGSAAIQLAKAMGHRIMVLSRSAEKRETLLKMGAEIPLNPSDADWPKKLKAHLKDCRVDLAIDAVGGTLLPQMIETLGAHGKVSCVGRSAGVVPQFNTATLFFRQLRLGGVAVGAYSRAEAQGAWQSILSLLAKTGDRPLIDSIYPFDRLPEAFERLTHSPLGKVVVKVA